MELINVKVATVKHSVREGTGKFGPWKLHIVRLDDPDWKDTDLSFFEDKNTKVMPEVGMECAVVEIEETDKGYQLKKLTSKGEKPKPKAKATGGGAGRGYEPRAIIVRPGEIVLDPTGKPIFTHPIVNPKSMYYSYAKDIVVAAIQANMKLGGKFALVYEDLAGLVVLLAEALYTASEKGAPKIKGAGSSQTSGKGQGDSTHDTNGEGKADPGANMEAESGQESTETTEEDAQKVNVAPLCKKIAGQVVGLTPKLAENILPRGLTPKRANAIIDFLNDHQEAIEVDEFVTEVARIVREVK